MAAPRDQIVETPWGRAVLHYVQSPDELDSWQMDEGFGQFSRFRSFFDSIESLKNQLNAPGAEMTVALTGDTITAYALSRPAPADERWAELEDPPMFELIIEAARGKRSGHVAKPLLKLLVDHPHNDQRIIYLVGYAWTWDLEESGKTMQEYRQTLKSLVEFLGLREYPTNEPNVAPAPGEPVHGPVGAGDRGRPAPQAPLHQPAFRYSGRLVDHGPGAMALAGLGGLPAAVLAGRRTNR